MKFYPTRFALAAATTTTLLKVVGHLVFRFFGCQLKALGWMGHHCRHMMKAAGKCKGAMPACSPMQMLFMKIAVVFVVTFAAAWFFAWFYNFLICNKACDTKK